jgi:hypothetical protein
MTEQELAELAEVEPAFVRRVVRPGVLGRLAALIDSISRGYAGRPVRWLGDGGMFVFREPADAVRAALEMVAQAPGAGLPPTHIGIHSGPVAFQDGDVYGTPSTSPPACPPPDRHRGASVNVVVPVVLGAGSSDAFRAIADIASTSTGDRQHAAQRMPLGSQREPGHARVGRMRHGPQGPARQGQHEEDSQDGRGQHEGVGRPQPVDQRAWPSRRGPAWERP